MARKVNAQYGVFLILLMVFMPSVTPIPLSISDRITLQVQPEYFMNHHLVLSLEPLEEEIREAESLQVDAPTSSTTPSDQEDPTSTTPTITTTPTTPSTENTTLPTTTSAPETTTEEITQDPIVIPSAPSRPMGEGDVDELLITIPYRCPPDYLLDPNGKCRPVFRRAFLNFNRARSFSDGLFSPPSSRHFAFLSAPSVPTISLPVSSQEFIPVSPGSSIPSPSFLAIVNQERPSRLAVKKGVDNFNKVN